MNKSAFLKTHSEPTIRTRKGPWSPANEAKCLEVAMKGFGTDEKAIYTILTARTNQERQEIAAAYSAEFNKSLLSNLKSELSGSLKDLIVALMETPVHFNCTELHRALTGWTGVDDNTLTEIAVTRSNAELKELATTYEILYKRPLVEHICSATGGDYRRLLTIIFTGNRDLPGKVDKEKAIQQAEILYKAGEAKFGTDEADFVQILGHTSYPQLAAVADAYKAAHCKTLEQVFNSELSGQLHRIALAIVELIKSEPTFYAKQLYTAMKGLGTDDRTLIRIIVSRSEIDLESIKKEYEWIYSETLESDVKPETSGHLMKALLKLIKGNQQSTEPTTPGGPVSNTTSSASVKPNKSTKH